MKHYAIFLGIVAAALVVVAFIQSRPDSVTLTSDKWECQIAVPKGIRTVCTNYVVRVR